MPAPPDHLEAANAGEPAAFTKLALVQVVEELLTPLPAQATGSDVVAGAEQRIEMPAHPFFEQEPVDIVVDEREEDLAAIKCEEASQQIQGRP